MKPLPQDEVVPENESARKALISALLSQAIAEPAPPEPLVQSVARSLVRNAAEEAKRALEEARAEEERFPLEIPDDFYPQADPRVRSAKFWAATRLLRGDKVNGIVKRLGITNQTFANWRREPDFYRFLKDSVELEFGEYTTKLREVAPRSVEVLAEAQEHKDVSIRIKAAGRLLTSADRLLDRAAGIPAGGGGGTPLIVFPPGARVAILAQPQAENETNDHSSQTIEDVVSSVLHLVEKDPEDAVP